MQHDTRDTRGLPVRRSGKAVHRSRLHGPVGAASLLLVGTILLTGCNIGPDPAPLVTPTPVIRKATVPHRAPLWIQFDPDVTGSYPKDLAHAFLLQMADWIDKLPVVNSGDTTLYLTAINSQPYAPASTFATFTIDGVENWPAPPTPTPVPTCPQDPWQCSSAKATVTTANAAAESSYAQAVTVVQAKLARVQAATKAQTQKLRSVRLAQDFRATSIYGVLNLASQRFAGAQGEKWVILATDLGNNTNIDFLPPNLKGVHVLVLYLYTQSARDFQRLTATWSQVFKQAGAASWQFLDPAASKNFACPWS